MRFAIITSISAVMMIGGLAPGGAKAMPPGLEVIALTGERAPGQIGVFTSFGEPMLSDSGELLFMADLGPDEFGYNAQSGIFRTTPQRGIVPIAVRGEALPQGSATYSLFTDADISNNGQVVFRSLLDGGGTAIVYDEPGRSSEIARTGAASGVNFTGLGRPTLSDNFIAFGAVTEANNQSQQGIYVVGRGVSPRVTSGQPSPDGNGTFLILNQPAVNNTRQVAFTARLSDSVAGDDDDTGLFLFNIRGGSPLVREGQPAPDGDGVFDTLQLLPLSLNDAGEVAFLSALRDSTTGIGDSGIFLASEQSLEQIARVGDPLPAPLSGEFTYLRRPVLNSAGQVAFTAMYRDEVGEFRNGLFLTTDGALTAFALAGDPLPDGDGHFDSFGDIAINNSGGIAFVASTADRARRQAVYVADSRFGLQQVIREGIEIDGSLVSSLRLSLLGGDVRSGLNDAGQVAITFRLADGRSGLALYTPVPEPGSVVLLLVALVSTAAVPARMAKSFVA